MTNRFPLALRTREERLRDRLRSAIYLGSEEWTKRMRALVEPKPRSTDHPKKQRAVGRPAMHTILATVAAVAKMPREQVRTRGAGALRWLVAWLGWHEGLVTLRSIAAALRLRSEGHISPLIRRCEEAFSRDATLLAHLDAALARLRA